MIVFNMWYGNLIDEVDNIDYGFNESDCCYRGTAYIKDKAVGDFVALSYADIWKAFKHLRGGRTDEKLQQTGVRTHTD